MEYNRDLEAYGTAGEGAGDKYVLKYARLDDGATAGVDETSWVNVTVGNMDATNKAEMDCLMCHLDGSNPGSSWLQTLGCDGTNQIGPMVDTDCSGVSDYGPNFKTVSVSDGVSEYDMYNRNFALKQRRMDLMASMGAGAKGVWSGTALTGVSWDLNGPGDGITTATAADLALVGTAVDDATKEAMTSCYDYTYVGGAAPYQIDAVYDCVQIPSAKMAYTPKSESCAVCHARDDNTMGLPALMGMKTGYGNYGLIADPSNLTLTGGNMGSGQDLDTDNGVGAANDDYWFDFGCKTGMGKRAHKIGATEDYVGANGRYGMSMMLPSTLGGTNPDGSTVPHAGDPIPGKMPDVDVHDAAGMQCATCHYSLGSDQPEGYVDIPATTSHGFDFPAERIYAMDHQFAQADSLPDTKGKNNLDAMLQCGVCHLERTHPNLTDNGGTLVAPTPAHSGFPGLHFDKIGCVTCHVPETYSAPGRLKYRDWTAGFARGTFRNNLDWNFNMVTGSHDTVPNLRKWATKNGETKIYPFLPSILPTWYEMVPNSGVIADNPLAIGDFDAYGKCDDTDPATVGLDCTVAGGECVTGTCVQTKYPSPAKNRDVQRVAELVRDAHPEFDMRLNGGNTVPLFDGFQVVDGWEIDTVVEIDTMLAMFASQAAAYDAGDTEAADARHVTFLNAIQADFDVTHGIVPKQWALGGVNQGGCVSCHSSRAQVVSVDPMSPDFMAPNPNYSPYSIGFFEGYVQPIDNAGLPNFGVGALEMVKNPLNMFADFDVAAMCGANDSTKTISMTDTLTPMVTAMFPAWPAANVDGMVAQMVMMMQDDDSANHNNYYFNPMTNEPATDALCADWSWFSNNFMMGTAGWCPVDTCMYDMDGDGTPETAGGACTPSQDGAMGTDSECDQTATLAVGIGMMTSTFDQAMGFPSGTAAMMGMSDGVAGIQGLALKELQTSGTLGCNPFAGPPSFSPMAGVSVNNCMPNYADAGVEAAVDVVMGLGTAATFATMFNGTCTGPAVGMAPASCQGGFRNNSGCAVDADCAGAMTDVNEIFHNMLGLPMSRTMATSHFKVDLQQDYVVADDLTTGKIRWTAGGDKNPGNPAHVNSWNQANFCLDYNTAPNPMMPNVVLCTDAKAISPMDGKRHIATGINQNQYLGYTPAYLATLMNPDTAKNNPAYDGGMDVIAFASALADMDLDLTVTLDGSRSTCGTWDTSGNFTAGTCSYVWDLDGGTIVGGVAGDEVLVVSYTAEGTYNPTLTVSMTDTVNYYGEGATVSDSSTVSVEASIVTDSVVVNDILTVGGVTAGEDITNNAGDVIDTKPRYTFNAPAWDADVERITVYWGDRTSTQYNVGDTLTHVYDAEGTYDIRIESIAQWVNADGYTTRVTKDEIAANVDVSLP